MLLPQRFRLPVRARRFLARVVVALLVAWLAVLPPLTALAQSDPMSDPPPLERRTLVAPAAVHEEDTWSNGEARGCIIPLGAAYDAAFIASFILPFVGAFYANVAAFGANLGLKYCAPVVEAPENITRNGPGPRCAADVLQRKTSARYGNSFGVPSPNVTHGMGWGDLDSPAIYHLNSQVSVTLREPGPGPRYAWPSIQPGALDLPVGVHRVYWRGDTLKSQFDEAWFIAIPLGAMNLSKAYKEDGGVSARLLSWLALKLGFAAAQRFVTPYPHGVFNDDEQVITVYDVEAPTFQGFDQNVTVEAGIPGGASALDNFYKLRSGFSVTDDCDPNVDVTPVTSLFWPVGETSTIRWVARDSGPSASGVTNRAERVQNVLVQDTNPPIIAPPIAVVTETASGNVVLPLLSPPVFDFADLNPDVTNNQGGKAVGDGYQFPKGKTMVTWTAEDASGNTSTAQQLVNVKQIGENRPPTANGQTGPEATSFEPMTLTLTASDPDNDPLWFTVEEQPENGFFVAPLFPYFIEDYRVESNITQEELNAQCDAWPTAGSDYFDLAFPYQAEYVAVQDDGTTFVLDLGQIGPCPRNDTNQDAHTNWRFVIFDGDGNFVGSNNANESYEDIFIDRANDRIYATLRSNPGGPGYVNQYDGELNLIHAYRTDYAEPPPNDNSQIREPVSAVVDPNGIFYIADRVNGTLRAHSLEIDGCCGPTTLGSIFENIPTEWQIDDLAVDSAGHLYVSMRGNDRIYKYSPSTLADNGTFTAGQLIGWMGKCDADLGDGTTVHCDVANHRSIGFSCTDATCGVAPAPDPDPARCSPEQIGGACTSGSAPGQFDEPMGIAVDPNDNLYVTDYRNERVQRFTPEGYYAGQAVSKCGGGCFVLGDFGPPKDITVNSDHFYILDDSTNLLHVSQTSPIVEATDTTAKVVYQSDNNFVGTDSFKFQVTDGLVKSSLATVNVPVKRNFRPPFARAGLSAVVQEDTPTPVTMSGSDPDVPLDTLTYAITRPPANGTLSGGDGATRTYTPDPDYSGPDSFEFTVSDGQTTSAPEVFDVTVSEVNDPPQVASPASVPVGIGYRTTISASMLDPDMGDIHQLVIDWGDGTVQGQAASVAAFMNGEGPMLSDSRNGVAAVFGEHVYTSAPSGPVSVCITDAAAVERCRTINTNVTSLVDVIASVEPSSGPVAVGQEIVYTIMVGNVAPETGGGNTATNVVVRDNLDPGVTFRSATSTQGSCAFDDGTITCNLGSLAPDVMAAIDVKLAPQGSLGAGSYWEHIVDVALDQSTLRGEEEARGAITVVPPADYLVDSQLDGFDANPGDGVCATSNDRCSLRAAIEEANARNGTQSIGLARGVYQTDLSEEAVVQYIVLGTEATSAGPLVISDDVVIRGLGAYTSSVSAGNVDRVLIVRDNAQVTLRDLQIGDGSVEGEGGGLLIEDGRVTLDGVAFAQNSANQGGAIAMLAGTLSIARSHFVGNQALDGDGGAILVSGGSVEITNSTFGGNAATGRGGGIFNQGTLNLLHVTAVGNQAGEGGGLFNGSNATLGFTLLSDNEAETGPDCRGGFSANGPNLVQTPSGCNAGGAATGDPMLWALDDYGGDTLTYLLFAGSPARNAGTCQVQTDQRGRPRPAAGSCDIGALELGAQEGLLYMYLPHLDR